MNIEQIFQEELQSYNNIQSNLDSLVLEFKDTYAKYEDIKNTFRSTVSSRTFSHKDLTTLLEKHIAVVTQINDINRSIADVFKLIQNRIDTEGSN
jgi:hypothetical protein